MSASPVAAASTSGALAALLVAALMIAFVIALTRVATRLAPTWLAVPRGPLWALAGLLVFAIGALALAVGLDPLGALLRVLGAARHGPWGTVAALAISLSLLLLVALALRVALPERRSPRAPSGSFALLFGVAADGTSLEAVRRPLRVGLTGLILLALGAFLVASLAPAPAPSSPSPLLALALTALVGAALALARPPALRVASPARAAETPVADPQVTYHARLGSPPLFEREPATLGDDRFQRAIIGAFDAPGAHLVAAAAPPGAGKQRAARELVRRRTDSGHTILWICDRPPAAPMFGVQTISLAGLLSALEHGTRFPRLGLVVVDGAVAGSGQALATLRYALFRLFARQRTSPDLLLLSSAAPTSATAIARAIGAAEPRLVTPEHPLPTALIARFLLAAPPDPVLAAAAPADVRFVALDRPRPLARYPGAHAIAREYLIPSGGPLGRRMQEDRAASLVHDRTSRLLVALPGDRAAPLAQDSFARLHLRAALAEAPQDPARLRAVFSPALVDAELTALTHAGLVTETLGWEPMPGAAAGMRRLRWVSARLPAEDLEPVRTIALVEPRSGRTHHVAASRVDWDAFDGAIISLDDDPAGTRYEVLSGSAPGIEVQACDAPTTRVLVPTPLASATAIRTLTTRLVEPPKKVRLRLRGTRELEVWEARVALDALHHGVRQFSATPDLRGPEVRSLTRLRATPLQLPPLVTEARLLVFSEDRTPPGATASPAALHAMAHAVLEVLPCLFDNAADLGVTFTLPPEGPGAALVLYDKHPEGLGAALDLRDDDLEAIARAACELLECDCAAHCAACCESTACTLDPATGVGLDRLQALAILRAITRPQPVPLHPSPMPLRRTG